MNKIEDAHQNIKTIRVNLVIIIYYIKKRIVPDSICIEKNLLKMRKHNTALNSALSSSIPHPLGGRLIKDEATCPFTRTCCISYELGLSPKSFSKRLCS